VLLPHVLVQPARTHSVCQRTGRIGGAAWIRDGLKQTHDFAPTTATFSLTNIDDKTDDGTRSRPELRRLGKRLSVWASD
jgi:hypothetical protein